MKKNKKKSLKKVHAKIGTTPAKAEAAKKEESKSANKNVDKAAKAAANRAEKFEKQQKKYAASKARKEARNARKQTAKDMLNGVKKMQSSDKPTISIEERKKKQEERKKLSYNRHIASIKRRCKRQGFSEDATNTVVENAKALWDKAKAYNVVIVFSGNDVERHKLSMQVSEIAKDGDIKACCITNSTAFLKDMPKSSVDKLEELIAEKGVIYRYRTDNASPFDTVVLKKHKTKANKPHSVKCSKSRNVNFYNLRRLKKAEKEKLAEEKNDVKPVNKKPTQVKDIKEKSNKKAA